MSADDRHVVQRDFSSGAISGRMLMRADTEIYRTAALLLENWLPTTMGTVQRAPGTNFVEDLDTTAARIMPYLTAGNERSLVILTDKALRLVRNITDIPGEAYDSQGANITFRKNIVPNHEFKQELESWVVTPDQYYSSNGDGPLGVWWSPDQSQVGGTMVMRPRLYKFNDEVTCTATGQATVDVTTDRITLDTSIFYQDNPGDGSGGYDFQILVSANSDFSAPLYNETFKHTEYPVGSTIDVDTTFSLPTAAWTGTLYYKLEVTAKAITNDPYSNPRFRVGNFTLLANGETTLTEVPLTTPYEVADLQDLQYVQSPYSDKELVITHPRHRPHRLYFNTTDSVYKFEIIPFDSTGSAGAPSAWSVNNYPAACSSYNGRLVLAGGQTFKVATGDPVASVSETVWSTKVGDWNYFSPTTEVTPDASIEFTATYRSPIQWVYGHKNLLIGALEMEYICEADGIFSPSDLGVYLHSTNGSSNVQPAGFGSGVIFAAEAGTRVRRMTYVESEKGWVAPDLTVYNPEVVSPRVVRMVRVRNPQQMALIVTSRGDVAIYHSEGAVQGWSTFVLNGGRVLDVCVVLDANGVDVPFFVVERVIGGARKLYLEAIYNFIEAEFWNYTASARSYSFDNQTTTLDKLGHLEGKIVQVATKRRFLGFYKVQNGQIDISPNLVTRATAGLMHRCRMITLPPEKLDPGAQSRYSDFTVRTGWSTRPIINGERPPDRNPLANMGNSQPLDFVADIEVAKTGWDAFQPIEISEQIPFRCEVLGVFGKLKTGSSL